MPGAELKDGFQPNFQKNETDMIETIQKSNLKKTAHSIH